MPTVFISYRRDDAAGYAGRLHEALEQRFGRDRVFRDVDTLTPGEDFVEAIDARLRQCRVFLALIGREWLDARDAGGHRRLDHPHDHVRLEIAAALAQPQVRVIPVLIEGATMPAPERLPDDIRLLSRRHAISLRDDAWDHDVGRLAAAIAGAAGLHHAAAPAGGTSRAVNVGATLPRKRTVFGAAALLFAVAVAWFAGGRGEDAVPTREADSPAGTAATESITATRAGERAANGSSRATAPAPEGVAHGVELPPVAEAIHGGLVYTVLSASVAPADAGARQLRLRVRFTNDGRYDANAWDASFRLVAGGRTFAPNSNLNELVAGHSMLDGVVTFKIPSDMGPAVLRILSGDRVAELPLDLSPSGRPIDSERADSGDELSHARILELITEPRPLAQTADWRLTVERATMRRFVNALRVRFALRMTNRGRYPGGFPTLRLSAGGRAVAPLESPSVVVSPDSDGDATIEFEVRPDTRRVVLRVVAPDTTAELPIDVE